DRLLELEDLSSDIDGDLLGEVTLLDRGGDLGNVADLAGQVAGHDVHVVGQVFPDAADSLDLGLTTQPALGRKRAVEGRDLVREGVTLVLQLVDRLLELEDLSSDIDGDLLGEIALLNRGRDLGDVADLTGQVAGHEVHVVREVFPDAADSLDLGLTTQPA